MEDRTRRWLLVGVALLVWAGAVWLAVLQGRSLRDTDPSTGSVLLLGAWSLLAVASLYAALVQLLRARQAAEPRRPRPAPHTPRHRA